MKKELEFKLVKSATSFGGDRYEHGDKNKVGYIVLYLPQHISRVSPGATPYPQVKVTIEA